jgi:ribonuclease D
MSSTPVIRDADGAEALARTVHAAGRFALDFEFLWERTYRPIPCLAQVAVGGEVSIIDPIEGAPLDALAALVADPAIATIMHAPSADLTLLALHFDVRPKAIVDVQLAAGFVGYGAGQSLATLADRVLNVRLAKAESYSDWSKRPLSRAQLDYANEDVRYLETLADAIGATADAMGRATWVAEEHERRYGDAAEFVNDPSESWRKVKGQGRLSGRERAVLVAVAAWREREARRRDRPTNWLVQDRALIDLARRRPATPEALAAVRGVGERLRPQELTALLAAVKTGIEGPELFLPSPARPDLAARVEVLGALGSLVVSVRASAAKIAAPLVATRDEIESFILAVLTDGTDDHPIASGWRRELVGDALHALAEGRLALAPTSRPPYLAEVPTPEGGG